MKHWRKVRYKEEQKREGMSERETDKEYNAERELH